ncbi:MAG: HAMP domain-containing sensor histidine kinase, partial [Verrucomicrobiota bacterium]
IALYGGAIAVIFGLAVFAVFHFVEDGFVRRQLERQLKEPDATEHAFWFSGPVTDLPPAERQRLSGLPDGYHEFEQGNQEEHVLLRDARIAIYRAPESERTEHVLVVAVLSGILVSALVGWVIAWFLVRKAVYPIEHLSSQLATFDQLKTPAFDEGVFTNDEIGQFAESLRRYVDRQQEWVERESLFLRETSHELRTPITIIRGAYELIGEEPESLSLPQQERLERIGRAVRRMEQTVEGLLWLAREELIASEEPFEDQWDQLLREKKQIADPTLVWHIELNHHPEAASEARLLIIALGTLIENVIEHAEASAIRIRLDKQKAEVVDNGCGMKEDEEIFTRGLGLPMVQRICLRFGWELTIGPNQPTGAIVRIQRDHSSTQDGRPT